MLFFTLGGAVFGYRVDALLVLGFRDPRKTSLLSVTMVKIAMSVRPLERLVIFNPRSHLNLASQRKRAGIHSLAIFRPHVYLRTNKHEIAAL